MNRVRLSLVLDHVVSSRHVNPLGRILSSWFVGSYKEMFGIPYEHLWQENKGQ
jgi:hypothetical protein